MLFFWKSSRNAGLGFNEVFVGPGRVAWGSSGSFFVKQTNEFNSPLDISGMWKIILLLPFPSTGRADYYFSALNSIGN